MTAPRCKCIVLPGTKTDRANHNTGSVCFHSNIFRRKTGTDQRIRIRGLKTPLFLYQGFGVSVMTEMELFKGGGFNADDMGLGKVCFYIWLLQNGCLLL